MLFESIREIIKIFSPAGVYRFQAGDKTLAELCGFSARDRLLIVNADDFGLCESTNLAVRELLQDGIVSSVSLLAGAKGSNNAIKILNDMESPAGIHLALTSEWTTPVLGPVLTYDKVGSLLNTNGQFYSEIEHLYLTAENTEVEAECRAQIESALSRGIVIDHLDSHMGALQLRPDFVEIYLRVAEDYDLPIRMGSPALAEMMGMSSPRLEQAKRAGHVFPDNLIYIPMSFTPDKETRFTAYDFAIRNIPAGITEAYFHPTLNGDDFRSLQHEYSKRKDVSYESIRLWDYEYLSSGRLKNILKEQGIEVLDYRSLLDIRRNKLKV
jgi:predicted glycoside hydrolase/deacetylase ChbG (UPF0249 family)